MLFVCVALSCFYVLIGAVLVCFVFEFCFLCLVSVCCYRLLFLLFCCWFVCSSRFVRLGSVCLFFLLVLMLTLLMCFVVVVFWVFLCYVCN